MHGRHNFYLKLLVLGRVNIYRRPQVVHTWIKPSMRRFVIGLYVWWNVFLFLNNRGGENATVSGIGKTRHRPISLIKP